MKADLRISFKDFHQTQKPAGLGLQKERRPCVSWPRGSFSLTNQRFDMNEITRSKNDAHLKEIRGRVAPITRQSAQPAEPTASITTAPARRRKNPGKILSSTQSRDFLGCLRLAQCQSTRQISWSTASSSVARAF